MFLNDPENLFDKLILAFFSSKMSPVLLEAELLFECKSPLPSPCQLPFQSEKVVRKS